MKTTDIIARAGRNLRQAKLRTILTSLAISIGAFVIMTSLAFGTGINNYTDSLVGTNINDRTIRVAKEAAGVAMTTGMDGGLKEYAENYNDMYRMEMLGQADIEKLEKVSEVERVIAFQLVNMKYFEIEGNTKKWSSGLNMYDPLVVNESLAGKLPSRNTNIAKDEIVVPEDYVSDLGMTPEQTIGKTVTATFSIPPTETNIRELNIDLTQMTPELASQLEKGFEKSFKFKVVAVSKNIPMSLNTSSMSINEVRYKEIGDVINRGTDNFEKYMQLIAVIKKNIKPEDAKKSIEDQTGLKAMTARELQQMISQVTNIMQIVVMSFGILSLVVSVFGIINTMYVSVLERTSQIGLMKALGMRSKHVAALFRYEAAWVGFIGGVVGVGLSWIVGTLMNPWISEKVGFKPEDGIYLLKYDIAPAVVLLVVLVLIAIVSGFLPARKAAKLDPIEALRTE